MPMMKAMTITINSLSPRLKYGCDGGYNMVVKGPSVVVLLLFVSAQGCNLMEFRQYWNTRVIGQFYAILFVEEEARHMHWMLEGK
jgi:hypothetical protein